MVNANATLGGGCPVPPSPSSFLNRVGNGFAASVEYANNLTALFGSKTESEASPFSRACCQGCSTGALDSLTEFTFHLFLDTLLFLFILNAMHKVASQGVFRKAFLPLSPNGRSLLPLS